MSTALIGIDISKLTFDVVLLIEGRSLHRVFDNTPGGFTALLKWLAGLGVRQGHACMEATGRYGEALAHALHAAGYTVSVVNPARIKKYAASQLRRTKTDKADAALIADFARTQPLRDWQPPDPEWQALQTQVRYLDSLQTMRQQTVNRLKATPPSPLVCQMLQQQLAFLDAQLAALKQAIHTFIDQQPALHQAYRLLLSIPGIGPLTAARLLAFIPDFRAFDSPRQLAAFAGLTPGLVQSGSSVHPPAHLVKTGQADLRRALYFPAIVAKQHNPLIRDFCARLQARGKHPKAIIAAAMRKLLHLAFGVLKHQRPFDPLFSL